MSQQELINEIEEYKPMMEEWENKYYPTANEDPDYFIKKNEQQLKLKKLEKMYLSYLDEAQNKHKIKVINKK